MGQNRTRNQFFCDFFKFGSLVFLEIAYNDSLQQCLTSTRGKIHQKKFWSPNFGQKGQNWAGNQVFCHFLKFGSLVFLEIAYNDSLQQCMISSRGKTHEKNFGDQIWVKMGQNQIFCHFLKFGSLVLLDIAQDDSLEHCLTTSRGQGEGGKIGGKLPFSQGCIISFATMPNIQYETSRKKNVAQIGVETIFSILMLSSVHLNLLVYFRLVT